MIGMGETRLEDAFGEAMAALEGVPLFTMTQAQRLIGFFGDFKTGDWSDKARHTVAKNAYRLRERSEPNNRITFRKRKEIVKLVEFELGQVSYTDFIGITVLRCG
jgi:hypothetical protein